MVTLTTSYHNALPGPMQKSGTLLLLHSSVKYVHQINVKTNDYVYVRVYMDYPLNLVQYMYKTKTLLSSNENSP